MVEEREKIVCKQEEPSVSCSGRLQTSYREFSLIDFLKNQVYVIFFYYSLLCHCPNFFPKLVGVLRSISVASIPAQEQ